MDNQKNNLDSNQLDEEIKENNEAVVDENDETTVVITEIESINQAINNPVEIESLSSIENNFLHLISLDQLDFTEDLTESQSFYYERAFQTPEAQNIVHENVESESDIEIINLSSTTSSIIEQSKSWAESFLTMIFGKKIKLSNETSNITIPSINSAEDARIVDEEAVRVAETTADDLENQGAAGTVHLSAIGNITGRRIIVFSSNMNLISSQEAARTQTNSPIELQYHTPRNGQIHGHWTLIGDRDPEFIQGSLNDCLFIVVAAQTGRQPSELRRETVEYLRMHLNSLAARIQALARARDCNEIILLIGGARYNGRSPSDAATILDNSQIRRCHPGHQQGHPRGHASNPVASGQTESAENYSRNSWKTGFLSQNDQNNVAHEVLNTEQVQNAMKSLNNGAVSIATTIDSSQLQRRLPRAAEFNDGQMGEPRSITQLVIVLRHHAGQANNPNHDVFVHTFYPKI